MHYQFSTMNEELISEICATREINVMRCTDAVMVYISLANVDLSTVKVAKKVEDDILCYIATGEAKIEKPQNGTLFESTVNLFEYMRTEIYLTVTNPMVSVKMFDGMLQIRFEVDTPKDIEAEVIFRA